MTAAKSVLTIGLEPELVDFSSIPHLDAAKVRAGLERDRQALLALGYDAHTLLTDLGETAEAVVRARLAATPFDCVLIGAGIRTLPAHFLLFEKLITVSGIGSDARLSNSRATSFCTEGSGQ